jgi:hypothetical protein
MSMPPPRFTTDRVIFVGLAIILGVLLIYFALSSIPTALRPTLQPASSTSTSATP